MADVTLKGFAGLRNTLPAERIQHAPSSDNPLVDLTQADNVDLDNSGQLSLRDGTTQRVAGAAHSLWAQGSDCFYMAGASLKRLNPDFSSTTVATGIVPDRTAAWLKVNGTTYWTNGEQTGLIEGSGRPWGIAIPFFPPGLQAVAGTLSAGSYQAAITHWRDGVEGGSTPPVTITLDDGQGVRFVLDAPDDATITDIGLYLSEPNGMVLYHMGNVPANAANADVTSAAFATPMDKAWLDAPPPGQCLAYSRGRIFIAVGAFLHATAALGYQYCDLRDFLALDSTKIQFCIGVEHGVFVGTRQKVYFLAGDRLEELNLKTVADGASVAGSAVHADGFAVTGNPALAGAQCVLFATASGVILGMPDGTVQNLSADRYRFDVTETGSACFRVTDTLNQYLLFLQS